MMMIPGHRITNRFDGLVTASLDREIVLLRLLTITARRADHSTNRRKASTSGFLNRYNKPTRKNAVSNPAPERSSNLSTYPRAWIRSFLGAFFVLGSAMPLNERTS